MICLTKVSSIMINLTITNLIIVMVSLAKVN
jgi:hypothetical protein